MRYVLLTIDSTIAAESVFEPQRSDRTFKILASDYTQLVLVPSLLALAAEARCTAHFSFVAQNSTPSKDLERGEADLLIPCRRSPRDRAPREGDPVT